MPNDTGSLGVGVGLGVDVAVGGAGVKVNAGVSVADGTDCPHADNANILINITISRMVAPFLFFANKKQKASLVFMISPW